MKTWLHPNIPMTNPNGQGPQNIDVFSESILTRLSRGGGDDSLFREANALWHEKVLIHLRIPFRINKLVKCTKRS